MEHGDVIYTLPVPRRADSSAPTAASTAVAAASLPPAADHPTVYPQISAGGPAALAAASGAAAAGRPAQQRPGREGERQHRQREKAPSHAYAAATAATAAATAAAAAAVAGRPNQAGAAMRDVSSAGGAAPLSSWPPAGTIQPAHSQASRGVAAEGAVGAAGMQDAPASADPRSLLYCPEDIIFCADVDMETTKEVRAGGSRQQQQQQHHAEAAAVASFSLNRMDLLRQSMLLLMFSKLRIDPRHRFAVATIGDELDWILPSFSGVPSQVSDAISRIQPGGHFSSCDLLPLIRFAAAEAPKAQAAGRSLRVILLYSRSSVVPTVSRLVPRLATAPFFFDCVYLHDKPEPNRNCPQEVFDAITTIGDSLAHGDSYLLETRGSTATRSMFKMVGQLLAHPLQRRRHDLCALPRAMEVPSLG